MSGAIGVGAIGSFVIGGASSSKGGTDLSTLQFGSGGSGSSTPIVGKATQFSPTANAVFGFQATLDGTIYSVTVPWNVSRQDWYILIKNASGTVVVSNPRVGSPDPPEFGVNLVGGYFTTSTMYYYPSSGVFVVAP